MPAADQDDGSLENIFDDLKSAVGDLDGPDPEPRKQVRKQVGTGGIEAAADTTFPTEMNCSQVFDQLLKCYSLAGQIRTYYRYGEISYCHDKRNKMKFCLGTKLMSEDERRDKIRHWHMERLAEQQTNKGTSEIVWKSREAPLRLPFREDSAKYLNESSN